MRKIKMADEDDDDDEYAGDDRIWEEEGTDADGRTDGRISSWHFKNSDVRARGARKGKRSGAKQVPVRNAKLIRPAHRSLVRERSKVQQEEDKRATKMEPPFVLSRRRHICERAPHSTVHKNIGRGMRRTVCEKADDCV